MELSLNGERYKSFNLPHTRSDGTIRKRLFRSPKADIQAINSFRPTLSPLPSVNGDCVDRSRISFDRQFLATPKPSRVEKLSGQKRPSVVNIEGTSSVRKRLVVTNSAACESRQAAYLASWLNHELLHPFHPLNSFSADVRFPQYRISQDPNFLRSLHDMHGLWTSGHFSALRSRLNSDLHKSRIDFKSEVDLFNDIPLRRKWASVILSNYHPGWLLPALSVIFNLNLAADLDYALYSSQTPGTQRDENSVLLQFLEDVLLTTILSSHQCPFSRFSDNFLPPSPRLPDVERINFHLLILQRTLELILFLDACKTSSQIHLQAEPSLFGTGSVMKSSTEMVIELSRTFFFSDTDLYAFLCLRNMRLSYKVPACEVMRSLHVDNLDTDLRDGIRLCKLAALLTKEKKLLYKVNVPQAQNMQREIQKMKVSNVELAMLTLQKFASRNYNLRFSWYCNASDVVEGNLSKILPFLWQVVALWRDTELLKTPSLQAELKAVKETFRENKRKVPRLNQSPKANMCLAEISPSVVSPSNLQIYEHCENPNSRLLLEWCAVVSGIYGLSIRDFTESFRDGAALCLLLHHYYPDFVHLDEFVRLKPAELRTNDESNQEMRHVQSNFDFFASRIRLLGSFPHIPVSAEAALGPGFTSTEKAHSFGRLVDLLVSYLFSLITFQKDSAGLMAETSLLFEESKERTAHDQAAKLITRVLKHNQVKWRMEDFETSTSSNYLSVKVHSSPNSGKTSCLSSRFLRSPSPVGNSNAAPLNDVPRRGQQMSSSPFAGPTSYQKYLPKSPRLRTTSQGEIKSNTEQSGPSGLAVVPKVSEHRFGGVVGTSDSVQNNLSSEKKVSEENLAVSLTNREDQTFKFNRFFHPSVVLLQACVRRFLARKLFKSHINETSLPEVKCPTETSPDRFDFTAPNLDVQAEILASLDSKRNMTEQVVLQIYKHLDSVNKFRDRMVEYEKNFTELELASSVCEEERQPLPEVGSAPLLSLGDQSTPSNDSRVCIVSAALPPHRGMYSEDTVDITTPHVTQAMRSIENCDERSPQHKECSSLNVMLRSPLSCSATQRAEQECSEIKSMIVATKVKTPQFSASKASKSMSPDEVRRAGPLSRAFGLANRLATMMLSFSSNIASHVDDSLTAGQAAVNASGSKSSLRLRHHSDDSEIEDVARIGQYLAQSRSSPFPHRTSRRIMAPSESECEEEDCNDDDEDDDHNDADDSASAKEHLSQALQVASIRFDEEQERRNRDREQTAQQAARHRFELEVKLVKLATEQRNDEIIFSKTQRSLEMEMEDLEKECATFENHLSYFEGTENWCEEVWKELLEIKDSEDSSGYDIVLKEYSACDGLFATMYADRLQTRLSEAEISYVEYISGLQTSRRIRAEQHSRFKELQSGSIRLENMFIAKLSDINLQMKNIDLRRSSLNDALARASETELLCAVDGFEMSHTPDAEVPVSHYSEVNNAYGSVVQKYDELLRIRLSDLLEAAQDAFDRESEERSAFRTLQWVRRRETSLCLRELAFQISTERDSHFTEMENLESLSCQGTQKYNDLSNYNRAVSKYRDDDDCSGIASPVFMDQKEVDLASSRDHSGTVGFEKLCVEYEHVLDQRLCEVLEDAAERFMEFMSDRKMVLHQVWISSRNRDIFKREWEEMESMYLHAAHEEEESIAKQILRSRLRRDQLVELLSRETYDPLLDEKCSSALIAINEFPALNEEFSDTLAEEYRVTLSQESNIRIEREYENLIEIHEHALERFNKCLQSRRTQRIDEWVRRKELDIKLRGVLAEAEPSLGSEDNELDEENEAYIHGKEALSKLDISTTMTYNKIATLFGKCEKYIASEHSWLSFVDDMEQIHSTLTSHIEKEQLHSKYSDTLQLAEDRFDITLGSRLQAHEEAMLGRSEARTILQIYAAQDERDKQSFCEAEIQFNLILSDSKVKFDYYTNMLENELPVIEECMQSVNFNVGLQEQCNISAENNENGCLDSFEVTNALYQEILSARDMEELEKRLECAELRFKEQDILARSRNLDAWLGRMKSSLNLKELAACDNKVSQSFAGEMDCLDRMSVELDVEYQQACSENVSQHETSMALENTILCSDDDEIGPSERELMVLIRDTEVLISILINEQSVLQLELESLSAAIQNEEIGSEAENEQSSPIQVESSVVMDVEEVKLDKTNEYTQLNKFTQNPKLNDNATEEEDVIILRQSRRSTGRPSRKPLQNVFVERELHNSPPVLQSETDLNQRAPLLSSEFVTEEDEFVSLSSFASVPSSSIHRWGIPSSQMCGEQSHVVSGLDLSEQLGLMRTPGRPRASPELGDERALDKRLVTPSVSLWRIGESSPCLPNASLGRLSAELDALAKGMSPNQSDFLLPTGDSINELKGVMRRISEAAVSSSTSRNSLETPPRSDAPAATSSAVASSVVTSSAVKSLLDANSPVHLSPYASIIRNVLMVMRQCIRSDEYTMLVRLGVKIISDFCALLGCIKMVLEVEDSIDIISTCVQFYRDDEIIFSGGVDVLFQMSRDALGHVYLKEHKEILQRLNRVKELVTDQMARAERNASRLQKANLVINALKRRKNGVKPTMSLAEEVSKFEQETRSGNAEMVAALRKLSEVVMLIA